MSGLNLFPITSCCDIFAISSGSSKNFNFFCNRCCISNLFNRAVSPFGETI